MLQPEKKPGANRRNEREGKEGNEKIIGKFRISNLGYSYFPTALRCSASRIFKSSHYHTPNFSSNFDTQLFHDNVPNGPNDTVLSMGGLLFYSSEKKEAEL